MNGRPRLLNYLTSPNVVVWSAVLCSCALPEFYGPQQLFVKNTKTGGLENYHSEETNIVQEYIDGSFTGDLPLEEISALFNVNSFITTQVNPHGVPFVWNLNPRDNASSLEKLYF